MSGRARDPVLTRFAGIAGLGAAIPAGAPPPSDAELARAGPASEAERAMFTAAAGRRWIGEGESLEGLMIEAARRAIDDARVSGSEIDRVYGYGIVARYQSPNPVFAVHAALGLPRSTWVVPVAIDFSSFLTSLALAREAIMAKTCHRALVVAGAFLSRHVHPSSGYAVSIGDAAAAAVVEAAGETVVTAPMGRPLRALIVDCAQETRSDLYQAGMISAEASPVAEGLFGPPAFRLNPALLEPMREHGIEGPVGLARGLLAKNGVDASRVTLITHQASRVLMDLWRQAIAPAAYLDTYDELGNISAASTGVTLALRHAEVRTPYVLLLSVGAGMHSAATLLRTPGA